jgi:hypothetical protein
VTRRSSWLDTLAGDAGTLDLAEATREELAALDDKLFELWNLGENVLLGWTHSSGALLFLSVRHHVIPESIHAGMDGSDWTRDAQSFVNALLSGQKYLTPEEFHRARHALACRVTAVRIEFQVENERLAALLSNMLLRYSVSLVSNHAVMLLDAVEFSLAPPLDQMAMLNSLAYSINSAYSQLASKNIRVDFARTTTGDGFYIWNRAASDEANTELYKLMLVILADNAVAQTKARNPWVPRLRAAFHVGDHYEFHQVDGLNPTTFSYIVGKVTVDLARMLESARPGQILLGDFVTHVEGAVAGRPIRCDTLGFVENTAATLDQLNGLEISGGRIGGIRCYLTGPGAEGGQYMINRYYLRDKHGTTRAAYNAKINIHRGAADPIFLGIQHDALQNFNATKVEALSRERAVSGSMLVRRSRVVSLPK